MPSIRTYFSQRDDLQKVILQHLNEAQVKVLIAVAWFTDTVLFQRLLELQHNGVGVELIITKHQFNTESRNDHHLIKEGGGIFLEIGGDESLMHHKFCIVDHRVVLNGSFNWTRRANQSNSETLTVISDDNQTIFEFSEEFERLKRLAGLEKEVQALHIGKALQYFKLIRTFIGMNRPADMLPYLQEIKDIEELKSITSLLLAGKYEEAEREMKEFERRYTAVANVSFYEKEELVFKIRILSEQIRQLEVEKAEIEEVIASFNHRFILELNPIIARILELKKKLAEKFGISDEEFEELNEKYEQVGKELKDEKEKDVPELSEEEAADIKKLYYEASKLCHPDSSTCVINDKRKAEEVFDLLSKAYKSRNYAEVKRIYEELKSGHFNSENLMESEVEQLRRRLAALEKKYEHILSMICQIKITEPYLTIEKVTDWEEYFSAQKSNLESEKTELENKYFKS